MPKLYILAGPNGAGKSSFHANWIATGLIHKDLAFANVDNIAKNLGGYTYEHYQAASDRYRQIIKDLLNSGSDFMIETNLADNRTYDWLRSIQKTGYELVLYFLSTTDLEINLGRIENRVAKGGHDVAKSIVTTRYHQSHSYLKTSLRIFSEVSLIENSLVTPELQVKIENGNITYRAESISDWVKDIISVFERLHRRR